MQRDALVRFLFGDVTRGAAADPARSSPRGPPSPLGFVLLLLASFASLPAIYRLLADAAPPFVAIGTGAVAMGLAWAAGCALEGRRRGTVLGLAAAGAVAFLAVLVAPGVSDFGAVRIPLGAMSALSAVGLVAVARRGARRA